MHPPPTRSPPTLRRTSRLNTAAIRAAPWPPQVADILKNPARSQESSFTNILHLRAQVGNSTLVERFALDHSATHTFLSRRLRRRIRNNSRAVGLGKVDVHSSSRIPQN